MSLVDLLKSPDVVAVRAALDILDEMLRNIPASRMLFESCSGVDRLEDLVCGDGALNPNADWAAGEEDSFGVAADGLSDTAARLLDDLFDNNDTGDDDSNDCINNLAPSQQNNQFVFGHTTTAPDAFAFDNGGVPRAGRGRGRTLPAWMQQ